MSSPSLNGDEPPPPQEGHAEPPVESPGEAESSTRGPPASRVSFSTTTNAKPTMRPKGSSSNVASSSSSLSCKSSGTHLLADIASHLDVSIPVRDMIMNDPEAVAAQFDVSPFRLWLLFRSVDDNQDGFISKQELVRALSSTTTTNTTGADESDNPPSPRTEQMELLGNMTEEEDDDDESMEDVLPLQDMQALDELFDRIVCSAEKHNGELDVGTHNGDGSCSAADKRDGDKNDNENDDRDSSENDQKTTQRRNVVPPSSTNSLPEANQFPPHQHDQQHQQPAADAVGISFPQFCRVIRYLWLQQLLNPKLDDETTSNNGKSGKNDPQQRLPPSPDPSSSNDNGYQFECVDYASGYYRHKTIFGHAGNHKRTRDFFTAPRHGRARMRWIDVPSGTFVQLAQLQQQQYSSHQPTLDQKYSFRMTILRLAVKYRFHPTSVEDAMDLEYQEPKVNSFEHALLDLGNFNCGTISWLRHAGALNTNDSAQESNENNGSRNGYEFTSSSTTNLHPSSSAQFGLNDSAVSMPRPRPAARASSTASFHSYHKESVPDNIPDFVMAEGEEDVNINEGRHYFITIPMFELSRRSQTSLDLYKEAADLLPFMQVQPLIIEVNEATLGIFVASLPDSNLVVTCSTKWRSTRIQPFSFRDNHHANAKQRKAIAKSIKHSAKSPSNRSYSNGTGTQFHDFGDQESDSSGDPSCADDEREDEGDATIRAILQNEKMSLERVKELLKKRHSIQRHRNSSWLMVRPSRMTLSYYSLTWIYPQFCLRNLAKLTLWIFSMP